MDISQKAKVLVDALPYIKKYFDKTQEKYLEDVEFNITVKVYSSY